MDENNLYQEPLQPIKKKKSPLLFIIPVVIVAFLVVFFVVPPVLSNSLASKGDYKKAISIVKLNPIYKSKANDLQAEYYAYDCMKQCKDEFKNPDSIKIRDVTVYDYSKNDTKLSVTTIRVQAENGFGGTTISYINYNNIKKKYIGYTDNLDQTDYSLDDDIILQQRAISAKLIQIMENNFTKRDVHIDINRLNKAVKSIWLK